MSQQQPAGGQRREEKKTPFGCSTAISGPGEEEAASAASVGRKYSVEQKRLCEGFYILLN